MTIDRTVFVLGALLGGMLLTTTAQADGGGGAIIVNDESTPCLTPEERVMAQALTGTGPTSGKPARFKFYPMAGRLYRDLFISNFVDLAPPGTILSWECTDYSYDGHDASDTIIRSFGEQAIGVPIFAALDGLVLFTHDGEFDMNTECQGVGNHVVVNHANGRATRYWHFKKNSVIVSPAQWVRAGEPLGLTGSSGCSTYPHLHFSTHDFGAVFEPWAGECRPGESGWIDQPPVDTDLHPIDFGITWQNMAGYQGPPYEFPRSGQIGLSDNFVYVWWITNHLPANSRWRLEFQRPDGTFAFVSSNSQFANPFWRWSWWWWSFNIPDMHTIVGTWHVHLFINDELMVIAPIEVVKTRTADFNRPPEPITVFLDPAEPTIADVIHCKVDTSLVLDDLDYDIVRYEYIWTVDGQEVRHVTTAAHSDMIPHHIASAGELIECTVTPRDAMAAGPTTSAAATVGCPQPLDFGCDGDIDLTDYGQFFACVTGPGETTSGECVAADTDGDGDADLLDFATLMRRLTNDCGVRVVEHPVDQIVCLGGMATFHATADAETPLYQWRHNGHTIFGETNSTLVIDTVTADDTGEYLAYVVSDCALDYSRSATLSVRPPPEVVTPPEDASTCLGAAASFTVDADGFAPLHYQWQHNDADIPNATDAAYSIALVAPDDLGQYRAVVTDGCGLTVESTRAELTLGQEPVITGQPSGATPCVGGSVFLFVFADDAVSFQWYKDDVPIAGATSSFFALSGVTQDDSGVYHASAIGACGSAASDPANVTVIDCVP